MLANVYVPTAKIAQMMQAGEVAGCVIPNELIQRLEKEKKPERLERAALMVAAVKDLGFAGAHIGGFDLSHRDFMTISERAAAIGSGWRTRMDELVLPVAKEFYLLPLGKEGLERRRRQIPARQHTSRMPPFPNGSRSRCTVTSLPTVPWARAFSAPT